MAHSRLTRHMLSALALGALLMLAVGSTDTDTSSSTSSRQDNKLQTKTQPKKVAQVDKSPEMQKKRKDFIEKLIQKGIFAKVEVPGSLPRLWIKPAFYALEFESKEKFVSVVYTYYFDGTDYSDTVRIFDNLSGKQVGTYSAINPGLKMD